MRIVFGMPKAVVMANIKRIHLVLHNRPIEQHVVIECEDMPKLGKKSAACRVLLRFDVVWPVRVAFGDRSDERVLDGSRVAPQTPRQRDGRWLVDFHYRCRVLKVLDHDLKVLCFERVEELCDMWSFREISVLVERPVGEDVRLERDTEAVAEQQVAVPNAIDRRHRVLE